MMQILSHVVRRIVLLALVGSVLVTAGTAAGASTPTCADLTFQNDSAVDLKVKEVVNGKEVTRELVAPGGQVTITVNSASDVWRVRRPGDRAKLWQGPSSCADERIVFGGAGERDNDAPTLAINSIGTVASPVVIAGTFNDQSEIVEVKAAVRAAGTRTYYRPDGTPGGWHRLDLNGLNANGTADWETPPLNLPAGDYEILTRAIDEHGNQSPWIRTSFSVVDASSGPCTVTFTNDTGEEFDVTKSGEGVLGTLAPGDSLSVVVEPGERYYAFQNFRVIWQWENSPAGLVPDNCTTRTVSVDGTCVDLTVTNSSGEPIKVKRNTPAGERTVETLAAGATGTYDWSHSTEALVIRRPSNFSRLLSRNIGACGDVSVTVQSDFTTPVEFG